jgi:hypothetical protein
MASLRGASCSVPGDLLAKSIVDKVALVHVFLRVSSFLPANQHFITFVPYVLSPCDSPDLLHPRALSYGFHS